MQTIIDRLIPQKDLNGIIIAILLFCVIPFTATLLSAAYRYQLANVCRRMGLKLAIRGFENLICQPVAYFDRENSAELASYCRGEAMKYIVFWMIDIPQLASTGIAGILIFSYLLTLHAGLAFFLLLYIPIAFFPSNWFASRVRNHTSRIVGNNAKMNQIINDMFRGIKTVKSLVLEHHQLKKLKDVNAESVSIWSKTAFMDNMSGIWVDHFSDMLFTGITFGMAAYAVVIGQMTLDSLIVVLNYTGKFLGVVKQFMHTTKPSWANMINFLPF